jgi:hypothetical protein
MRFIESRRGLLKLLGKGSLFGTVAVATGVKAVAAPEKPAYRFTCNCNKEVIASIPDSKGEVIHRRCECGLLWRLTWMGDHFRTYQFEAHEEPERYRKVGLLRIEN